MGMVIYAVDPGTAQSALVIYEPDIARVSHRATLPNDTLLERLAATTPETAVLAVEKIEAMGMAVGAETFATVWWAGRFHQAWRGRAEQVTRRDVKLHLCGSMRAKDANIRQAILDRFGGKVAAIGRKAAPGPLYGLRGHEYAALAVALTWADTRAQEPRRAPE
jgi:hypothetical protein